MLFKAFFFHLSLWILAMPMRPETYLSCNCRILELKLPTISYMVKMLVDVYRKDSGNKDVQTYESVTYDGVEYNLHDCVIFYRAGETETYIGKIVEIIDTADVGKQLRVVWFFRPSEIRNYLRDYEPRWNEIFLASGEGKGLSTMNILVI